MISDYFIGIPRVFYLNLNFLGNISLDEIVRVCLFYRYECKIYLPLHTVFSHFYFFFPIMAFRVNDGLVKIVQKLTLLFVTAYLYTIFSSVIPTCQIIKAGWKIYPFDKKFFTSSMLFMASAASTIVECNVWPYNTRPCNKIIKFFGEVRKCILKFS